MGGELLRLAVVLVLAVPAILPWLYLRSASTPWNVVIAAALVAVTIVVLLWVARHVPERPAAQWLRLGTLLAAAGTATVHALWLIPAVARGTTGSA